MPRLPTYKAWPWWVQKATEMTATIGAITALVLAFDQFASWQPIATKTWVTTYVDGALRPVVEVQDAARRDRLNTAADLSALTVQTLTYQILQMQLQLETLTDKDGQTFSDRQLAQRLRNEITKSQALIDHADCIRENLTLTIPKPCPSGS